MRPPSTSHATNSRLELDARLPSVVVRGQHVGIHCDSALFLVFGQWERALAEMNLLVVARREPPSARSVR